MVMNYTGITINIYSLLIEIRRTFGYQYAINNYCFGDVKPFMEVFEMFRLLRYFYYDVFGQMIDFLV